MKRFNRLLIICVALLHGASNCAFPSLSKIKDRRGITVQAKLDELSPLIASPQHARATQEIKSFEARIVDAVAGIFKSLSVQSLGNFERIKTEKLSETMSAAPNLAALTGIVESADRLCKKIPHDRGKEEMGTIVLLKSCSAVAHGTQQEIMQTLDALQQCLDYWIEQQHHPVRYFFHKSPHKWFFGKPQKNEVQQKIKKIRALQSDYFLLLGQLTTQIDRFERSDALGDYISWCAQFLATASRVVHIKQQSLPVDAKQYQETLDQLKMTLHALAHSNERIQKLITPCAIPNHFARNWLTYAGTIVTAGALALYHYKNPSKLPDMWDRLKRGTVSYWTQQRDAFNAVRDIVMPYNEPVDDNLANELAQIHSPAREELLSTIRNEFNVAMTHLQNLINKDTSLTPAQKLEILNAVNAGDEHKLSQWVSELSGRTIWNLACGPLAEAVFAIVLLLRARGMAALAEAKLLLEEARVLLKKLDRQGSLTLAGVAFIPTAIAAYGIYKAAATTYNYLKPQPYNFVPIKESLADVEETLNLYSGYDSNATIQSEDLGKLVYGIYKLRNELRYVQEPARWKFELDIRGLEQPSLTVGQKLRLIDIMHHRYEFLR